MIVDRSKMGMRPMLIVPKDADISRLQLKMFKSTPSFTSGFLRCFMFQNTRMRCISFCLVPYMNQFIQEELLLKSSLQGANSPALLNIQILGFSLSFSLRISHASLQKPDNQAMDGTQFMTVF
ncbi:hypothetical protein H6P81_017027 [Aristolochia fimbriata]|uniref:Uncharacterized protein n=1 Tax=Aristolochia fimbriata TaxID=158543 RepID=A0AAV7DX74_ARIFI|nr:hypothetical protein H6P81_017027 [Aristolochia fimbriata]